MTIEEKLKDYIISNYKSLRNFVNTSGVNMPYTTVDGIFKRGIGSASIDNVFRICDALGISADALIEGDIIPKNIYEGKEYTEFDYIFDQMLIDGEPLGDYEKTRMKRALHNEAEGIRETREMLKPQMEYFDTPKGKFALDKKTNRKFFIAPDNTFIPYKDDSFIDKIIEEFNQKKDKE